MPDVMLDLETMGTSPNAAIIAIGAVAFDADAGMITAPNLSRIGLDAAARGIWDVWRISRLGRDAAPEGWVTWDELASAAGTGTFPGLAEIHATCLAEAERALTNYFAATAATTTAADLAAALTEAVETYGKPGGPWNVPSEPGSWIAKARAALAAHQALTNDITTTAPAEVTNG